MCLDLIRVGAAGCDTIFLKGVHCSGRELMKLSICLLRTKFSFRGQWGVCPPSPHDLTARGSTEKEWVRSKNIGKLLLQGKKKDISGIMVQHEICPQWSQIRVSTAATPWRLLFREAKRSDTK
ncbi:hypothetical protein Taro_022669 [Colocasia esculenta]|uniref:Uncharacterized protein n=1 Tax=Colocasia esculenta TaxID=4460 RepID=A0A843V8L5_COLES|nr:hypothetical protein [Colocasia esculenta]